jgi:hypothetical protein
MARTNEQDDAIHAARILARAQVLTAVLAARNLHLAMTAEPEVLRQLLAVVDILMNEVVEVD